MKAQIITVGDEILIGQILDTNSQYIAYGLNQIGYNIVGISSVADERVSIISAVDEALQKADLTIITGGLGPTSDDITKHTLAEYFNSKLIVDKDVERHVQYLIAAKSGIALERNLKQAEIPETCEVLHNKVGTAPGMWFKKDGRHLISLPGIPYEMKILMNEQVIPRLKERFKLPYIIHKTVVTKGLPESVLAEKLVDFEMNMNSRIKLAYLPSPERLRLRFSIHGNKDEDIDKIIIAEVEKLNKIIPDNIIGYNDEKLEEVIGKLLINKNKTISAAESCTGGNIAHLITSIAGSSHYFLGSVVAYSNDVKEKVLGVKRQSLINHGAVSKNVVEEMAYGAMKLFGSDYAVSVSGIAGPEGGTETKPAGTVWIAVASIDRIISRKFSFTTLRDINIRRASGEALDMLRLFILQKI